MLDERSDVSMLAEIKTYMDAHGVASAVIEDHVAIGISGGGLSPGESVQNIVRVKSMEEARFAIGYTGGDVGA